MIIEEIERRLDALRPSERRVAEEVLRAPLVATEAPLGVLAERAGVSEPTVIRFCRAVGCRGYRDLKRRLLTDLARRMPLVHRDVTVEDTVDDFVDRIFDRVFEDLRHARSRLDHAALERAIMFLAEADTIEVYGFGASGIAGQDAQHRFTRLGVPTVAYSDPHLMAATAGLARPGRVVLAISNSGESADLLDIVQIARGRAATVVAITAAGSALADIAHAAIGVDVDEDASAQMPMNSRLAHLLILDALYVGVAIQRGVEAEENLAVTKRALLTHKSAARARADTSGQS